MNNKNFLIVVFLFIAFFIPFAKAQWIFKTNGRIYSSPVVSEGMLFFGSGDSTFYAVNKSNGKQIWKYKTQGAVHSTPVIAGERIFFGSADGNLYSAEIETGKIIWKFESNGEKMLDVWDYYLSSPQAANGKIYWGCGDGNFYAINSFNGKLEWSFHSGAIIHATPLIANETVYFGDYNGKFYALNAETGQLNWQFKTVGDMYFPKGEIQKGATIGNNIIYFGSRDYNIYALNAKTGTGHWNMKERGSWIIAEPLIYKENIYFGTSDTHRFYCLNKTNGNTVWQINIPMRAYGSAVAHNNIIYFGCFDGKLRGVDAETGKVKWEFQTEGSKINYSKVYNEEGRFKEGFELYGTDYLETEKLIHNLGAILSTPVIENNIIYFGSSDGGLYAVPLN